MYNSFIIIMIIIVIIIIHIINTLCHINDIVIYYFKNIIHFICIYII